MMTHEVLIGGEESGGIGYGRFLLWGMGFATAGLTAFYMFRLWFLTFFGEFRGTLHPVRAQAKFHTQARCVIERGTPGVRKV